MIRPGTKEDCRKIADIVLKCDRVYTKTANGKVVCFDYDDEILTIKELVQKFGISISVAKTRGVPQTCMKCYNEYRSAEYIAKALEELVEESNRKDAEKKRNNNDLNQNNDNVEEELKFDEEENITVHNFSEEDMLTKLKVEFGRLGEEIHKFIFPRFEEEMKKTREELEKTKVELDTAKQELITANELIRKYADIGENAAIYLNKTPFSRLFGNDFSDVIPIAKALHSIKVSNKYNMGVARDINKRLAKANFYKEEKRPYDHHYSITDKLKNFAEDNRHAVMYGDVYTATKDKGLYAVTCKEEEVYMSQCLWGLVLDELYKEGLISANYFNDKLIDNNNND